MIRPWRWRPTDASASYGSRYSVDWALTSGGTEANPSDNTATTEVFVAREVFLPVVLRGD
jgi:hypothetical protein